MFLPKYLSFSGTYQCNLACPHCCVPIEWKDRLSIPVAIRFLEDARKNGITTVAFTGGEPCIYPEFVIALTKRAVELGCKFDRVMTNGVWWETEAELDGFLTSLRDVGFSGKMGLSVDKFHGIAIEKLAKFCLRSRVIFDRDNIVSLNYASRAPDKGLEPIEKLARALGGVIDWSPMLRRYMLVSDDLSMTLNWNHLAPVERAESYEGGWDGTWFNEDYCEGPGQALIITPKGEVKPCCGFASDLDQLTIGNIHTDSVKQIIEQARAHPVVGRIFSKGLSSIVEEILERDPNALPGKSSNQCFVCWYVLTRGLVAGVGGGGGQIGPWQGNRPNFQGELLTLGIKK